MGHTRPGRRLLRAGDSAPKAGTSWMVRRVAPELELINWKPASTRGCSTESLEFCSRNQTSTENDGRHTARVRDIGQRVGVEQDQPGLLSDFNRAFVSEAS